MNNYEFLKELDGAKHSSSLIVSLSIGLALSVGLSIGLYFSLKQTRKQLIALQSVHRNELPSEINNIRTDTGTNDETNK
jgi:hypothetical protein